MKPTISIFDFERAVMYSDLPSSVRLTLFVLRTFANKHGDSIFPSYDTIAERTGLSKRTVIRAISKAVDEGWIEKELRSDNGMHITNNYKLTTPVTRCHHDTTLVTPRHHPSDTVTPNHTIEQTNEQNISNTNPENLNPAVQMLQKEIPKELPLTHKSDIINTVTDLDLWGTIIWEFSSSGYNLTLVSNLLDAYRKRIKQKDNPNGKNTRKNGNTARHVNPEELAKSGERTIAMLQRLGYD